MTAPEPQADMPRRYDGCCRAAVDSDGHAHDHSQWYAELVEARQAHAEALADNVRVAHEMAALTLTVERLKAEVDRLTQADAQVDAAVRATDTAHAEVERHRAAAMDLIAKLYLAETERDDYRDRLKATNEAYRLQCVKLCAAEAERDAMRPVVEAAKALRALGSGSGSMDLLRQAGRRAALYAAVDQLGARTAPSERQAGQDGPEVGAVGVGGSEAPTCQVCGVEVSWQTRVPADRIMTDGGYWAVVAVETNNGPCGHSYRERF